MQPRNKQLTAKARNQMLAEFVFIAPFGALLGNLCYSGLTSMGIKHAVLQLILIVAGIAVAGIALSALWKRKKYRTDLVIPSRMGMNDTGHMMLFIGSVGMLIVVTLPIIFRVGQDGFEITTGDVISLGIGFFAMPLWIIGATLVHASTTRAHPTPDTHILCPDCKALILKESRSCELCGCKLVPLAE